MYNGITLKKSSFPHVPLCSVIFVSCIIDTSSRIILSLYCRVDVQSINKASDKWRNCNKYLIEEIFVDTPILQSVIQLSIDCNKWWTKKPINCLVWHSASICVERLVVWELIMEISGIRLSLKASLEQFTLIDSTEFWMFHQIRWKTRRMFYLLPSDCFVRTYSNIVFRSRLTFVWPSDVSVVPCLNCNISCHLITCLMSRLTLLTDSSINLSRVSAWFISPLKVLWRPTQIVQFYRLPCGKSCFLWPTGHQFVYLDRIPVEKTPILYVQYNPYKDKFLCASPRPRVPWFMISVSVLFFIPHNNVRMWYSIFK